jgi:hypothetical protein
MAVHRKASDATSKEYWRFVDQVSREAERLPDYLKGGQSKRSVPVQDHAQQKAGTKKK